MRILRWGAQQARQAKHRAFVVWRRVPLSKNVIRANDARWRRHFAKHPYVYDPAQHAHTFLAEPPPPDGGASELPRVIWCVWTGDNPLTENRERGLASLREQHAGTDVQVRLVTPADLDQWLVEGHPLHPAYEFLSLNHRSDYLRAYLLHHHGGGYSDIKPTPRSWAPSFDLLEQHPESWALGYPELSSSLCAQLPGAYGRLVKHHFPLFIGNSAFIYRSHTPMTASWLAALERDLDVAVDELRAHPGGMWGRTPGYPLRWGQLMADIGQPLQLKYHGRFLQDGRMQPGFVDYR
ncbi:hypothetical protein [Allobranchiibius sp. GilTou73]|uniref:hypothetical protein n=1 Tax=Allobranchiibius sp. GilTou73 TaxID=2904523 RepID=UPI001F1FA169|nr:hypothetical protein [Allobranchiibius sp. GilTou73]UIJ35540.1 hypothetical protein LVQ62_03875 [Allobranchiibius sp. GilTou73]